MTKKKASRICKTSNFSFEILNSNINNISKNENGCRSVDKGNGEKKGINEKKYAISTMVGIL